MTANLSIKNFLSGLIFITIGLAFGYAAYSYDVGTALRMGPGYFPLILAFIMVVLGLAILVQAFLAGADELPLGTVPWFGMLLLVGALIFFGVTVRGLGLLPSLFVTVFLSSFASSKTTVVGALIMAAGLSALCMAIFVFALGLPLQTIGPWLNF